LGGHAFDTEGARDAYYDRRPMAIVPTTSSNFGLLEKPGLEFDLAGKHRGQTRPPTQ
jgi:hypothetical protein